MKSFRIIYLLINISVFWGCMKSSDYSASAAYKNKLGDLSMVWTVDSLPADGSSKDTLTLYFLKGDSKDSINIAQLNLTVTTSGGSWVTTSQSGGSSGGSGGSGSSSSQSGSSSSQSSISPVPAYKQDSAGNLNLTTQIVLQSSTKSGIVQLKFTYAGVEVDTSMDFYKVYPDKMTMNAYSLAVTPDFSDLDTIYVQLSKTTGTPSQGNTCQLFAFDSTFKNTLGIVQPPSGKSNATGLCTFTFVLGDSLVNKVNYRGTIHLIGIAANGTGSIKDTLNIYSR